MDSAVLQKIRSEVERILPDIVQLRHTIHQNPEIACAEFETAALVRKTLAPENICLLNPFLETDVVAMMDGKGKGKNVTLRADMDALPMGEKTGLSYASRRKGFMHACGHDGHTAMLAGAAIVLSRLRKNIHGSVRFVFQPGEEIVAAGRDLVEKGALLNPEPDAVFALHGLSGLPEGVLGSRPGEMMAAADFFSLTVKGKGAHSSRPEIAIDPILVAARIVESLQSVVSRQTHPLDAVVLSVCRISGGTNANIIPDNVELEGSVRYLKPNLREKIKTDMERIINGVCQSMGAGYDLTYVSPYLPTINHAGVVAFGKNIVHKILGPSCWMDIETPSLSAEDFSYYITRYPGAFFRLGMGIDKPPLHNALFDFNDNAMKNGILFLVASALEMLGSET
jgi:hippurate hydrolase